MEPAGPAATPTRIPRPTFTTTSPRTPSIRSVPYNHMDRVATASWTTGSYSPSSWPFPKSAKSSSLDLSVATPQHRDACGNDINNMKRIETMRSDHRATASAASTLAMTEGLHRTAREGISGVHTRSIVSFESVETQIYAPRHRDNSVNGDHLRPNSAREPFVEPAEKVYERPMTPTPYSILRKVSEISEPRNDDNGDNPSAKDGHCPSLGSQHQEIMHHPSATHAPQGSTTERHSLNDINAMASMSSPVVVHATPVLRDEEGRVLSRLHPPFRVSVPDSQAQQLPYPVAGGSVQADYGSPDTGISASSPEGIIILNPLDVMETTPQAGISTRNNSLYSRRPTTIQSEMPGLGSLRLGPRLRHSRLPQSPSTAVNAGRSVPSSTKRLWSAVGRSRKMMVISAILLELSILNVVSSVTAVVVTHIGHGYAGTGLVAWAAVSGVFVLTFGALLAITFLQYRKMNKDLVSGENWIEMHLRSRPLPPRPQSEERKQDNRATEAWQKFVQDHAQLRRYVEFLESRIGVLEEGRPSASQQEEGPNVNAVGAGDDGPSCMKNSIGQPRGIHLSDDSSDNRPKAKGLNIGGSLSCGQLVQPEEAATGPESWLRGDHNGAIPNSDTKTSILTELCEAVTEGYSPLSEQLPRGSPQIPQTPHIRTPSGRPRGGNFQHLALPGRAVTHQRGACSADISSSNTNGI